MTEVSTDSPVAVRPHRFCAMIWIIAKREFAAYFRTTIAYVFLALFVLLAVGFPWHVLDLFESGQASLRFFNLTVPWVMALFAGATGMRLWSEERRSGTWELLFTFPVTLVQAVLAKFLAAWLFMIVGITLTLPLALALEYLGQPDWGAILGTYLGLVLMSGALLGVASLFSAATKSQIISLLLSVAAGIFLVVLGFSPFTDSILAMGFPISVADFIANLGVTTHFETLSKGLIRFSDVLYFVGLGGFSLWGTAVLLER
jgi:ABC-2 type transport system permease protein